MFIVSALLLDDAFKPAMPLTSGVISETLQQFAPHIDISQGSVVTRSCDTTYCQNFSTIFRHLKHSEIFVK